jgi:hypothetical protein
VTKKQSSIAVGDMVYVTWIDSAGSDGWQEASIDVNSSACESCGFLIERDKKFILIAGSKAVNGKEVNGTMQIPRAVVVGVRKLR